MKLNYIIYKYENQYDLPSPIQHYPIIKIYATGEASINEIISGTIQNKYPELFTSNMYCQILYFYPNIQPSLWDDKKFY